jgi:hypothetical protein
MTDQLRRGRPVHVTIVLPQRLLLLVVLIDRAVEALAQDIHLS